MRFGQVTILRIHDAHAMEGDEKRAARKYLHYFWFQTLQKVER
jgi:hypothetical protein